MNHRLAESSEEMCRLFKEYKAKGDIDSVLGLYEPEAVFLNHGGVAKKGREGVRQELAHFTSAKVIFDFKIRQAIQAGISHWCIRNGKFLRPSLLLCHRSRPSPAGWFMALANRRPIYPR